MVRNSGQVMWALERELPSNSGQINLLASSIHDAFSPLLHDTRIFAKKYEYGLSDGLCKVFRNLSAGVQSMNSGDSL